MSDDRLHDFDSTSAIFSAVGSLWKRLVAYFGSCWVAHYVGSNAATAGAFLRGLWQLGPKAILEQEQMNPIYVPLQMNPIYVPLSWIGTLLGGCSHPIGLVYLLIVLIAFLMVWMSEDRFPYAIAFLLVAQPIHSFLVDYGAGNAFDFSVGLVILATWEMGLIGVYWLFFRPTE
jgi:hypothetical protein